jgi:hypothetical protein
LLLNKKSEFAFLLFGEWDSGGCEDFGHLILQFLIISLIVQ